MWERPKQATVYNYIYGIYSGQNWKLATQNCMHFNQLCAKSFNLIFKVSLEPRQRSNQRRDEGSDMLLNKTGYTLCNYTEDRIESLQLRIVCTLTNCVQNHSISYSRSLLSPGREVIKDAMKAQQMIVLCPAFLSLGHLLSFHHTVVWSYNRK